MGDGVGFAVADNDIRLTRQDGSDQFGDVGAGVLVIAIGVDDDVGPQLQAGVQPGGESGGQPPVLREPHNVLHPQRPRYLHRPVVTAVIDDEQFHLVDASDDTRNIGHGGGQRLLFIQTGNLDDEFHMRLRYQIPTHGTAFALVGETGLEPVTPSL